MQEKAKFIYPDPRTADPRGHRFQRIFEMIPGSLAWFTLLGMFIFSFWLPVWVAVFIIAFDIYWLYRTLYIATYSIAAFRKMQCHKAIDWMKVCQKISEPEEFLKETEQHYRKTKDNFSEKRWKFFSAEKKSAKKKLCAAKELKKEIREILKRDRSKFLHWEDVFHVVMLPTANEGPEIIEPAIQAVAESQYPNEKFIILLATEEREDEEKREHKINYLKNKFGKTFFDFLVTVHRVAPREMKTKTSNTTSPPKKKNEKLEKKKNTL